MRGRAGALALAAVVLPGCSAFSAVRSAEVAPGRTVDVGLTISTPPGDDAAWFWTYDCAYACDRRIPAVDVSFTRGVVPDDGLPYAWGAGLSGFYPYVHGYVQLGEGRHPYGAGGRIGLSLAGWLEGAVFVRKDVALGSRTRLLLAPTLFLHAGSSPNGQNPGAFLAVAQGVGVEHDFGPVSLAPTALLVAGRVDRSSYGRAIEGNTFFAVLGLWVRFGERPPDSVPDRARPGPHSGKE